MKAINVRFFQLKSPLFLLVKPNDTHCC